MSRFDINDVQDFKAITMGGVGGVLNTLGLAGRDPSKWDILEASFNKVLFHVFQSKSEYQAALSSVHDSGGRRKVKYAYPYKDGQTTDDLGRMAQSFTMSAVIHGNRYLLGLSALIRELEKPTPGDLVHPIRGEFKVAVESYQITHVSDKRKCAELEIVFIEHNFTIGDIRQFKDTSVKGALSRLLDALNTIDKVITNVLGAVIFVTSLKNQITQALTDYKNRFSKTSVKINKTFNARGSSDFPGLLPVNEGGTVNADGTSASDIFTTLISSREFLDNVVVDVETITAVAVNDIKKQVVGLREDLTAIIDLMSTGAGYLEFYDDILSLKQTAVSMQDALEKGIASSNAQVIGYMLPRDMSLREVAYANGLQVDRVTDLDLLNPELLSINFIAKGTLVQVPVS